MKALRSALLMTALLTTVALRAWAADPCVKDGVILFPAPGAVVPTNVQFILQGTGEMQAKVQALISNGAIALVAEGKEAIQVKAEKGFVSQVSRVAVRLRPLKPLEPNVEYSLALPPEMTGVSLLNDQLGGGSLRWLAASGADKKPPRFKERPASSEGFYEQDKSGGLTRKLKLRTLIEESSPTYLLVSMQRAQGGSARQQFPVAIEGGTFTIGHDACSGNFGFDDGRAYKLTLELFDAAGNKATERPTLEVAAPRPLQ